MSDQTDAGRTSDDDDSGAQQRVDGIHVEFSDQTRTIIDALIVAAIGGLAAGTWGVIGGLLIYSIGASYHGRWDYIEARLSTGERTDAFGIDVEDVEADLRRQQGGSPSDDDD